MGEGFATRLRTDFAFILGTIGFNFRIAAFALGTLAFVFLTFGFGFRAASFFLLPSPFFPPPLRVATTRGREGRAADFAVLGERGFFFFIREDPWSGGLDVIC